MFVPGSGVMKDLALKPRLAVWCWGRRGGAANHTYEVVNALVRRGDMDISLCVSRQCDRLLDMRALGIPLLAVDTCKRAPLSLAASAWRLPIAAARFAAFLRAQRVKVVLCTFSHAWNPFVLPVIRVLRCLYILTVHDGMRHVGDRTHSPQRWFDFEVQAADALITLSGHVKTQIIDRLGLAPEKITIIQPGPYHSAGGPVRNLSEGPPRRLLFFGRIWPYKGIDLLLDAYSLLTARYPDLTLRIVGSGDFSPYKAAASRLHGVTTDIRYVPEEEVPAILGSGDILVLPYREASQSGLVSIAQAVGLPLVTTPVGGLVEQVVDSATGIIASAVTPEAIAAALDRLLDDVPLYRRLAGGIRAQGTDLWDDAAEKTADLVKAQCR